MNEIKETHGAYPEEIHEFQRLQTTLELLTARTEDPRLGFKRYWTGDNLLYQREGDRAILTFTEYPLISNNLADAVRQLRNNKTFEPSPEELQKAREQTLVEIDLSQIRSRLGGDSLLILFSDYQDQGRFNPEEEKLLRHIYGEKEEFEKKMEQLLVCGEEVTATGINFLSPEYVLDNVINGSGIARLCWSGCFDSPSVNLDVTNIDAFGIGFRGYAKNGII